MWWRSWTAMRAGSASRTSRSSSSTPSPARSWWAPSASSAAGGRTSARSPCAACTSSRKIRRPRSARPWRTSSGACPEAGGLRGVGSEPRSRGLDGGALHEDDHRQQRRDVRAVAAPVALHVRDDEIGENDEHDDGGAGDEEDDAGFERLRASRPDGRHEQDRYHEHDEHSSNGHPGYASRAGLELLERIGLAAPVSLTPNRAPR